MIIIYTVIKPELTSNYKFAKFDVNPALITVQVNLAHSNCVGRLNLKTGTEPVSETYSNAYAGNSPKRL
jgi:hypothetical protein